MYVCPFGSICVYNRAVVIFAYTVMDHLRVFISFKALTLQSSTSNVSKSPLVSSFITSCSSFLYSKQKETTGQDDKTKLTKLSYDDIDNIHLKGLENKNAKRHKNRIFHLTYFSCRLVLWQRFPD